MANGKPAVGFPTPSRKQEFYSQTMVDWKWPEYRIPTYIHSHVHPKHMDQEKGDYPLVPTFRLPVLIHSRSGNAKWLAEIANRNPIWIHTSDAQKFNIQTNDLVRVNTDIGYFVDKVWVTESMKPGVVACQRKLETVLFGDSAAPAFVKLALVRNARGNVPARLFDVGVRCDF